MQALAKQVGDVILINSSKKRETHHRGQGCYVIWWMMKFNDIYWRARANYIKKAKIVALDELGKYDADNEHEYR